MSSCMSIKFSRNAEGVRVERDEVSGAHAFGVAAKPGCANQ
jgi:hypothetical protein